MSYHIVGLRLVCDGAQRDRSNNVHVSQDPEILGGQTFLWDVMRGKGKRGLPFPAPSNCAYASLRGFALTVANCFLPKPMVHRKGTENR